jgi:hypothetical protein
MAGIFISYRRDDSAGHTGRLSDLLRSQFDPKQIFLDLNSIEPGEAFPAVIAANLASSHVLLAVIGPRWLSSVDSKGQSRLQDPTDFVRREIAAALERGIKTIPLLVGGAKMPQSGDLPADLTRLAQCQAFQLSDAEFPDDVSRLIAVLRSSVKPPALKKTKVLRLRAERATLSRDDVTAMLAMHGFYCRGWNEAGKGIAHEYKTMVQAGAVVVLDKATNLMWQKSGNNHATIFEETHLYIQELNAKKFASFADWRMPTLEEAMSLMTPKDGSGYLPPEFDGAVILWTADRATKDGSAWIVYFHDGLCTVESINFNGYIRAVRSALPIARPKSA